MQFSGEKINSFDKDAFKKELETTLEVYAHASGELGRLPYRSYSEEEKTELKSSEDETMQKMITLSAQAIKSANNKEEILEIINKVFWDAGNQVSAIEPGNLTSGRRLERFFQQIILELVK